MADEDALFAEFMGEIKSTVVAAETKAAADSGEDDGDISDTASVGDVKADDAVGGGEGRNYPDTTKRKGETEVCMTACTARYATSNRVAVVITED